MTTPHTITCLPSEYWWGLATNHGHNMPFADGVSIELRGDCQGNQASPVLLSSAGRWLWSPEPFLFRRSGDTLVLEGPGPWHEGRQSGGLRAAYLDAASQFFPASGALCDPSLFLSPQYNTWIELGYGPSQERILAYADTLLAQGYPPGVLMIDDGWMRAYGDWDFTAERFPDAKGMIERLHKLGFKVMIWLIPFISPDSPNYRQLRREKGLVTGPSGKPVLREWWNGTSALVDVTGGPGRAWFSAQMKRLRDTYGIDGFKLDGGDTCFHAADDITFSGTGPNGHTESFASLALDWPLNEFRAAWKNGGQPFAQRLRDKNHAWVTEGLAWLVPHAIAAGLLGHIFVCPDMIGGGEIDHFHSRRDNLDAELFVRYAQCSALMPMMQFSAAP